jgi:acyl dehydratase
MESRARYFEDWSVGDVVPPVEREIDERAVAAFLDLLQLDVPLFRDDRAARAAGHKRRIAPGPVLLSYAMASVVPSGWLAESLIGLLRMDAVEFKRPLYVGDCVRFTNHFVSKRASGKRDRGSVTLRLIATNQDGVTLLEFERTFLVKRRAEEP